MSRIIVKNLPKKITDDELKNLFSEKGVVTDVQLKYTKDGRFRQFAFVGYQSDVEAEAAVQYFDQSYFKSFRISVQPCPALGDESKPRSWSKYASDSSAFKKKNQEVVQNKKEKKETKSLTSNPLKKELVDKLKKFKNDPAFLEFMEAHNKEKSIWGNDDIVSLIKSMEKTTDKNEDSGVEEDTETTEEAVTKIADDQTISDADYLKLKTGQITLDEVQHENSEKKFFTLLIRGLPYKVKKKMIKEFFRPLKVDSIRIPRKIKGMAYVGFKCEKAMNKALLRDRSFIDGKRVFISQLKEKVPENSILADNSVEDKWKRQEESLHSEESIAESGRIFVRNLPYTSTEEELQSIFEKYGPVTEVIVPLDKITRKIKGYGVVTYLIPEHAVKAFTELDGIVFHGRMLHLLPGKAKDSVEQNIHEGSSYKSKKLQTLKAEAQSAHNWNTLFLGSNAVAETIASNYNISKEQVFSDNNAAVRLALGETQIVHETREFLESNGVKLDAFNRALNHRSKTIILVKNLPANTTINEIRNLFSKYGILGRVVLPPGGITGIVEFVEPAEARTAFKRLAYSRFKNLPLYLEWAPEDTFTSSSKEIDKRETKPKSSENENLPVSDELDEEPEPDTTLFVKNLNFETSEDTLKQHFSSCGKIASITIAKKKDPKKVGSFLPMGYGFVQFHKVQSLENALKTLQQSILDGHSIELKRSNRTLKTETHIDRKVNNVEKQTGSKILVRNIPFQAKHSELLELFKVFGEIKAVRLPQKIAGTGSHRGFAFVEYHTKEEAKRAMQSLCQSTHLYGRRLVLEWAQSAVEDLEQMRKRTAERFPEDKDTRNKKSRADIQIDESESEEDPEMFE